MLPVLEEIDWSRANVFTGKKRKKSILLLEEGYGVFRKGDERTRLFDDYSQSNYFLAGFGIIRNVNSAGV